MKVFYHRDCLLHNPAHEILSGKLVTYLESPSRLLLIQRALEESPDFELTDVLDESIDLPGAIIRVHSAEYLEYLRTAYDEWVADGGSKEGVVPETFPLISRHTAKSINPKELPPLARAGYFCFDLSCTITQDTFLATMASLKVTLTAANYLRGDDADGVFALCRPPGHHAGVTIAGGYCFLNNVAVAARYIQHGIADGTVAKVAVLDIDYHHGNGTQEIFYSDPTVLYVSLHAANDYPYFTGLPDETGDGEGVSFNLNIPLPRVSTGNNDYCNALERAVTRVKEYEPAYLLVSLGVDTHAEDPICEFGLSTSCYTRIGSCIATVQVPTLFVMEGGYHLESLGANVKNVLTGYQLGRQL